MLPPLSEMQLVTISLVVLLCGLGVGFILGSLWMEQRLTKRVSVDERSAHSAGRQPLRKNWRHNEDNTADDVRISA